VESADQIVADLAERGRLESAEEIVHRYPHCWRCQTPLIFRVVEDWYIAVDELRPQLLEANATVQWTPEYMGKRMDDWLRNMGDWNISRRRYFGLPLPFYPCSCGHLNVIGSMRELEERATHGLDQLEELHRPWIDAVTVRCEVCGNDVSRVPEVGDVWLDAGIVPFSTLGWQNPESVPQGYATGASKDLSTADLPDHSHWEKWFPADWVSEMREQIRLWFYSQLFMSVALTGRAPFREVLGYEKMLDEHGREMHGSWGNLIEAEDAFARMGADVMRWQFCAQPPTKTCGSVTGRATRSSGSSLRCGTRCRSSSSTPISDGSGLTTLTCQLSRASISSRSTDGSWPGPGCWCAAPRPAMRRRWR
jgi:isoleucyl-tRNA synthetase